VRTEGARVAQVEHVHVRGLASTHRQT